MAPPVFDRSAIRHRHQAIWASGDAAVVSAMLPIVSEHLCEAADLRAGEHVLDVATGSGNTAIAAARRFCRVSGIDLAPGVLERARARAVAEQFDIEFRLGDAEAMPYADASFDVVLSSFGAMFALNQEAAALELLRVCRSGGRIALASWTPDGFVGEMLRRIDRHILPPPGAVAPVLWGSEARLRTLFGDGVSYLTAKRQNVTLRFRSAEHWLGFFRSFDGPTHAAFASLDPGAQVRLAADLLDLARSANTSTGDDLTIPAEYLQVVAVRA